MTVDVAQLPARARRLTAIVPDTVDRVTADVRVKRTRDAMLTVGRSARRAQRLFGVVCVVASVAAVLWLVGVFLLFGGGLLAIGPVVMVLPTAVVPPAVLWAYRAALGRAAEIPTHVGDLGRLARGNLDALGITRQQDLAAIHRAATGGAWASLVRVVRHVGGLRSAYPVLGLVANPVVLLVVGVSLVAAAAVTVTALPLFAVGATSWLLLW